MNNVMVRFENGVEERMSEDFGPFEFVQLTYSELRVGVDGDDFAFWNGAYWVLMDHSLDPHNYSDVVIYSDPES